MPNRIGRRRPRRVRPPRPADQRRTVTEAPLDAWFGADRDTLAAQRDRQHLAPRGRRKPEPGIRSGQAAAVYRRTRLDAPREELKPGRDRRRDCGQIQSRPTRSSAASSRDGETRQHAARLVNTHVARTVRVPEAVRTERVRIAEKRRRAWQRRVERAVVWCAASVRERDHFGMAPIIASRAMTAPSMARGGYARGHRC